MRYINDIWFIADILSIKGKTYYLVDFHYCATLSTWKIVWKILKRDCNVLSHGTTAILIPQEKAKTLDIIISKYADKFKIENRWKKKANFPVQKSLFETLVNKKVIQQ